MAKSLLGSLPIYAQHLAEQTGVKVLVQGKRAYTDGKTVVVPFSEDDLHLSFGYIAHECSHVRNTDMGVFQEAVPVPFRKNLLNILEDIRIERLSMDQYPGTEDDIRYLNRKVLLEPFTPEHLGQAQPIQIIHNAILFGAYWKLQEPQLEAPAKAYLEALESLLGTELADKIMAEALNTLNCNSTQEVLQLVDAIIALLPSENEQPQQPEASSEQGEGEGEQGADSDSGDNSQDDGNNGAGESKQPDGKGGDDSSGDGDAEPSGEADAGRCGSATGGDGVEEGQPDSGQKSPSGDQSESGDGQNSDQAGGTGSGSAGQGQMASEATSQDGSQAGAQPGNAPKNLREQVLNATADDLKGLVSEVGDAAAALLGVKAASEHYPAAPFILAGRPVRRSPDASIRRIQLGMENSAGLRQILNGLLQAQVDCRVRLKRQGKRIDTSRIAMIKAGETRVFRSKARTQRSSAAIEFLLDISGSMDAAMDEAEAALYAVLQSVEGLPLVSTGAMSFPGSNSSLDGCCDLIKRSTERLAAAVQAGGFGIRAQGGTPLARAIWPAAVEVLRAKGERKILFVITDGEPNRGTAGDCKELFERCEASGIEVIGLGFGQANATVLGRIFKKYVAVGTVSNLKAALFGAVREALVA